MSAVVEFRNVGYSVGGREILRDLTFSVAAGETLVLLGRSGSGKTTALKMVNGLVAPTATANVTSLVTASSTGQITVTYTSAAGGGTLVMVPSSGGVPLSAGTVPTGGSINWNCTGGTTLTKYRPSACR